MSSIDVVEEYNFKYKLDRNNAYNILGKSLYFYNHSNKKIKNQFTILIVIGIIVSIVFFIINISLFILSLVLYILLFSICVNKAYMLFKDEKEIVISSKGIFMKNEDYLIEWDNIKLIGICKDIVTVTLNNTKRYFLIKNDKEIISTIKKYTDKIIEFED